MKFIASLVFVATALFALEVGQKLPQAQLSGENGGYVKGEKPFSSSDLQGKMFVIFYVDPDEKDTNEAFVEYLKSKGYSKNPSYQSVAIVNLAATWKPDFVIEKLLASKQKEFPKTIYVKDKKSVLVKAWDVADDASDIIIVDKTGKVVFYKAGKMDAADIQKACSIIEQGL